MALWLPFCAMLLTGCADDPTEVVRYVRPDVPESLLVCTPAPEVPGESATQRDVARFVVKLDDAGEDCRRKLGAVRGLVTAP